MTKKFILSRTRIVLSPTRPDSPLRTEQSGQQQPIDTLCNHAGEKVYNDSARILPNVIVCSCKLRLCSGKGTIGCLLDQSLWSRHDNIEF